MAFELLPEQGLARPAPYMQRAKWLDVTDPDALRDTDLGPICRSSQIIAASCRRKVRAELWARLTAAASRSGSAKLAHRAGGG